MDFTNIIFLFLFLPITVLVYYSPICRKESFRNLWLILASLIFYAWGEPVYIILLWISITVNYLFGRWLAPYAGTDKGKRIVFLACLYNLGILFVFKNYLGWILGRIGFQETGAYFSSHITFPLGISFFTFQAVSYIVDVYRRQTAGRVFQTLPSICPSSRKSRKGLLCGIRISAHRYKKERELLKIFMRASGYFP